MHIIAASIEAPNSSVIPIQGDGVSPGVQPGGFQEALIQASQPHTTAEPSALALQAEALGSVELITPLTPSPDVSELKAFAITQGLAPEAISWLFDPLNSTGSLPVGLTPADTTASLTDGVTNPNSLETQALLGTLPWVLAPGSMGPQAPASAPTTQGADPIALPAGWTSAQCQFIAGTKSPTPSTHSKSSADAVPEEVIDLLNLDPETQELLKKLGLLEGDSPRSKGALPHSPTLQSNELKTLIDPFQKPTLMAGQGAAAPTAAQAEAASPADRAAQIQALAQKIGEALGQRLMGNIERGQWQVRLLLRPASLGEIEVDLRLRAGELDATLRAMNPLTRELLVEGLPRLREGLSQAGMDVAQLHVGIGDGSRNGGNPTPRGFARKPEQSTHAGAEVSTGKLTVEQSTSRRQGANGWDVMV